jgi:hypothetical protein
MGTRTRKAAVAPLALVTSLAAACGSSGGGSGGAAAGTLRYATNGIVSCLDPQASATTLTGVIDRNSAYDQW